MLSQNGALGSLLEDLLAIGDKDNSAKSAGEGSKSDKRKQSLYFPEEMLEEIKEELPDAVAEIKQRERYEEWIKTLRGKAHIEIRKG